MFGETKYKPRQNSHQGQFERKRDKERRWEQSVEVVAATDKVCVHLQGVRHDMVCYGIRIVTGACCSNRGRDPILFCFDEAGTQRHTLKEASISNGLPSGSIPLSPLGLLRSWISCAPCKGPAQYPTLFAASWPYPIRARHAHADRHVCNCFVCTIRIYNLDFLSDCSPAVCIRSSVLLQYVVTGGFAAVTYPVFLRKAGPSKPLSSSN